MLATICIALQLTLATNLERLFYQDEPINYYVQHSLNVYTQLEANHCPLTLEDHQLIGALHAIDQKTAQ